jgi:hypothetical protein
VRLDAEMTRNRAILADIAEFRLDPTVPHAGTHANGRLAKVPVSASTVKEQEPAEQKVAPSEQPQTPTSEKPADSESVEVSSTSEAKSEVDESEPTTDSVSEPAPVVEQASSSKKKSKRSVTE